MAYAFNPFTGTFDNTGFVINLNSLSDVSLASPASGDILQYNGSLWVDVALSSFNFIDGTGVAGRVAHFSDSNTLTTSAGFSISGSTITVLNLVSDGNGSRSIGSSTNGFLNDYYSVPSGGALTNGTGMRLKLTGSKAANDGTCNIGLSGIYNTFYAQEAWRANDTTYQFSNLYQGSKGDEHLYLNYDIGPASAAGLAGFGAVRIGFFATYGGSPIEHYSRTASTRYVRFEWDTSDNYILSQFGTVTAFKIELDTLPKTTATYDLGSSSLEWDFGFFSSDVRMRSLILDGDVGSGIASTNKLTGVTDTPTTDPGWATSDTVAMTAPNGYIKAYVGTQAVVIPYWNT